MITAFWLLVAPPVLAGRPGPDAAWEELRDDIVRVECTEVGGEPWCRSHGLVAAPIDRLTQTLEHMAEHQDKFETVLSIRTLAPDTLHVTLDYPGMLSDRDYVAKYSRSTRDGEQIYSWTPVTHPEAPPRRGVVRLTQYGGEWRLRADGANTRVTYLWQADLGGSFPSWAVGLARRKAGHEALKDLAGAQGSKLLQP